MIMIVIIIITIIIIIGITITITITIIIIIIKPPNLHDNVIKASRVMGKILACNDEEQAIYPPNPPNPNGNDMYLSEVMGTNLGCRDEEEEQSGYPPNLNGNIFQASWARW